MVTDMSTDEINNNFQMVASSDGDINDRANEVHFLFSYQCRSENPNFVFLGVGSLNSNQRQLNLTPTQLNPNSTQLQLNSN